MREQVQILCVDDERNVLKALERIFLDDDFEIITAGSGEEGLVALAENPGIQLVISDYRMPGMDGVEFLKEVCVLRPDTVRIVLSGYADTAAVVAAINEGQIYKFIPKPWNDDELRLTALKAIEVFELQGRNQELTEELSLANDHLQGINEELERMVADRTAELTLQNRALSHSRNILHHLPVGVLAVVADGVLVQANAEAAAILGADVKSILCEKIDQMLPPILLPPIAETMTSGSPFCHTINFNGHKVQMRGVRIEEDQQLAVIVVLDRHCSEVVCNE